MTTDSPDSTDQLDGVAKGGHPCLNIFVSTPSLNPCNLCNLWLLFTGEERKGRREEAKKLRSGEAKKKISADQSNQGHQCFILLSIRLGPGIELENNKIFLDGREYGGEDEKLKGWEGKRQRN
jgi:hypothetical protein